MNKVDKEIGRLIRKAREHLRLPVDSVAEELGISSDKLLQYELGDSRPTPYQLLTLCAVLRVQPSWFFPEIWNPDENASERPATTSNSNAAVSPNPASSLLEERIEVSFPGQISVFVGRNSDEVVLRRVVAVLRQN